MRQRRSTLPGAARFVACFECVNPAVCSRLSTSARELQKPLPKDGVKLKELRIVAAMRISWRPSLLGWRPCIYLFNLRIVTALTG